MKKMTNEEEEEDLNVYLEQDKYLSNTNISLAWRWTKIFIHKEVMLQRVRLRFGYKKKLGMYQ